MSVCADEVIKGWEIGIATMARGEVARLRCAPSYAYGEAGSQPSVPANAVLVFDVEMLDFKGELCRVILISQSQTPSLLMLLVIHLVYNWDY